MDDATAAVLQRVPPEIWKDIFAFVRDGEPRWTAGPVHGPRPLDTGDWHDSNQSFGLVTPVAIPHFAQDLLALALIRKATADLALATLRERLFLPPSDASRLIAQAPWQHVRALTLVLPDTAVWGAKSGKLWHPALSSHSRKQSKILSSCLHLEGWLSLLPSLLFRLSTTTSLFSIRIDDNIGWISSDLGPVFLRLAEVPLPTLKRIDYRGRSDCWRSGRTNDETGWGLWGMAAHVPFDIFIQSVRETTEEIVMICGSFPILDIGNLRSLKLVRCKVVPLIHSRRLQTFAYGSPSETEFEEEDKEAKRRRRERMKEEWEPESQRAWMGIRLRSRFLRPLLPTPKTVPLAQRLTYLELTDFCDLSTTAYDLLHAVTSTVVTLTLNRVDLIPAAEGESFDLRAHEPILNWPSLKWEQLMVLNLGCLHPPPSFRLQHSSDSLQVAKELSDQWFGRSDLSSMLLIFTTATLRRISFLADERWFPTMVEEDVIRDKALREQGISDSDIREMKEWLDINDNWREDRKKMRVFGEGFMEECRRLFEEGLVTWPLEVVRFIVRRSSGGWVDGEMEKEEQEKGEWVDRMTEEREGDGVRAETTEEDGKYITQSLGEGWSCDEEDPDDDVIPPIGSRYKTPVADLRRAIKRSGLRRYARRVEAGSSSADTFEGY